MEKNTPRAILHTINALIGVGLLLNMCYFIACFEVSAMLFLIGFFVNLALALIYKKYLLYGRFKKTVIVLRSIAVAVLALLILTPIILLNFTETKFIYPVKRICYYAGFDNYILPPFLPKQCDDYMFITQADIPAQDYHASAYLAFHTDTETLRKYEEYFSSLDNAVLTEINLPDPDTYDLYENPQLVKRPGALPQHVFERLKLEHIHDFKNAVLYIVPDYYNKGCMLDYDSGLVVFWY